MNEETPKYYKFIKVYGDGTMMNRSYRYKMGLNVVENFNDEPRCTPDALYFTDLKHIHQFIEYGNILFEVSFPEDARVIQIDNNKYKTDKLFIECQVLNEKFLQIIYMKAIQYGHGLCYVPNKYKTYTMCKVCVHSNGMVLRFVPEEHKTLELCLIAVKRNKCSLDYVPEQLKTNKLIGEAVKQSSDCSCIIS